MMSVDLTIPKIYVVVGCNLLKVKTWKVHVQPYTHVPQPNCRYMHVGSLWLTSNIRVCILKK